MGAYIAAEFALAGHEVRVTASSRTSPRVAVARVVEAAGGGLCASQLRHASMSSTAAAGADLVVESLPEDLALKQHELLDAQRAAPSAILTTNTSSFTVGAIAAGLDDRTRLIGAHYVNPPWAFRVMEMIPSEHTDSALAEELDEILRELGRDPIRVMRDVPGFAFNRLQFALLREAAELVQAGVVTAEDLDRILVEGLGRRWSAVGPLASVTLGGLDLFRGIAERLYPYLSDSASPTQIESLGLTPARAARQRRERDRVLASGNDLPRLWRDRVAYMTSAA
jgi:3-hydroxybutyryl-CoA dehydrogenase